MNKQLKKTNQPYGLSKKDLKTVRECIKKLKKVREVSVNSQNKSYEESQFMFSIMIATDLLDKLEWELDEIL